MSNRVGVFLTIFIGLITKGYCYSTGAPISACSSMTPGHHGIAKDGESYDVTVSSALPGIYLKGENITIRINSIGFVGFLVEARLGRDFTAQGKFVNLQDGSHGVECSGLKNSAATHSSRSVKSNMTLTWNPFMTTAEVKFLLTIVRDFAHYSKLETKPLTYQGE